MYGREEKRKDFRYGLKRGLPIAIGYLPVSFSFGLMAVSAGLPVWLAVFISMSNLTSAGQFAGTNLILAGGGYFEIALTTFVINIRYMLMSLSLSQKLDERFSLPKRLLASFGITDEIFTMASLERGQLSFSYMAGLILLPFGGWTLGTLLGGLICAALPQAVSSAMGIALYGMFIAIIIPPAKKSGAIVMIIALSVAVSCMIKYIPVFQSVSSGFRVIIATLIGAAAGAALFPTADPEEPAVQAEQNESAELTAQPGQMLTGPEEQRNRTENEGEKGEAGQHV